jgi:hypothetical protein
MMWCLVKHRDFTFLPITVFTPTVPTLRLKGMVLRLRDCFAFIRCIYGNNNK